MSEPRCELAEKVCVNRDSMLTEGWALIEDVLLNARFLASASPDWQGRAEAYRRRWKQLIVDIVEHRIVPLG